MDMLSADPTAAPDPRLARLCGALFLVTFAASIPAFFWCCGPALHDPAFVLGQGFDRRLALGAVLELVVVAANIGTALTLLPLFARRFAVLAPAYVAARIMESGLIALGLVAMLGLNTLRVGDAAPDARLVAGQALLALHDWTFIVGPGLVVGMGNGLILGWMMWASQAVPRWMSILGLVGGPAILVSGLGVVLGFIPAGGEIQALATVPEFFWELFLGLWLLIRGAAPVRR